MNTKQNKYLSLSYLTWLMMVALLPFYANASQSGEILPVSNSSDEIVEKIISSTKKEELTQLNIQAPNFSKNSEELIELLVNEQKSSDKEIATLENSNSINDEPQEKHIDKVKSNDTEILDSLNPSIANEPIEQQNQLVKNKHEVFDVKFSLENINPSINLQFISELESLYTEFPYKIWYSDEDVKQFQLQLTLMALSGLNKQYAAWLDALALPNLSLNDKELILSDAMIGYLNFVNNVQKNKESWLYSKNSYKLRAADNQSILSWINAIKENNLSNFLTSLQPKHRAYEPMFKVLISSLNQNYVDWPKINANRSIKPNNVTEEIAKIEFILTHFGFLESIPPQSDNNDNLQVNVKSNNVYDDRLVDAVKKFQSSLGLTADGVIGPQTRQWLNTSPNQKVNLLALNIQRLRIIPNDISTGILVNIPDYSLKFYKEGELILDSRVIVGSNARKTPIMSNEINRVVINPPWSVPTRLAREDIAPKGIKDPHYFVRNGYSLVDLSDGQPIEVDQVLWENVDANNFPFAVRQKPGAGNSLGRYKFDMPNDQAIYLHDTPNHALFDRDVRAISSGCVRVNKSTELANLLLNLEQWDSDKVANTVKKGQTTPVKLTSKVPVELYYLTAWPNEQGQIQYRADIYGYDKIIENAKVDANFASLL